MTHTLFYLAITIYHQKILDFMKTLLHFLTCCIFLMQQAFSQSSTNYTVTAGSNESLTNMTGSTTLIGANQVTVASDVTNMTPSQDFEFWFMGTRYTQFSVSSNGILRFGSVAINGNANTPSLNFQQRICAFASGDGANDASCPTGTSDGDWRTLAGSGRIHYRVTGTAPDRILTTEWLNMEMEAGTGTADGTFQIRLHETKPANTNGGRIEIVYGSMRFPIAVPSCTGNNTQNVIRACIGISQNDNEFISLLTTGHPTVTGANISRTTAEGATLSATYTESAAVINLSSAADGSRKFYNFVSVAPNGTANNLGACPSSNEVTLNWTTSATVGLGYAIYRSNDGGATYQFETQVNGLGNLLYTSTGLSPNTTYFYRVYVVSEGKLSALGGTAQTSVTTTASPIVYSLRSGNWSDATLWTSGAVPTATQNVIIGCTTGHIVTVDMTTATCNNLTLYSGSNVTISSNQILTVRGNLTINNGGTLPKITMTSTSPTLEVRGHWIDLDNTVVAAGSNGLLHPGTSSTVIFGGTANQIINANNATPTLSTIQSTKPMIFHNLIINGDDVDLIYNDNKPIVINNDLTVNATKRFTYNLNMVGGGVGNIDLKGNMVNNGTIYSRNNGRHFLMSGASKTITGTGIYTNFPLQIAATGSVSLNTDASMRALWILSGGSFTVQNTPRTYTLTRSAVGSTTVELRNGGTLNYSGANIILGTNLDAIATANLINTGTWNQGTNSNFTFSGAGQQTVSNTSVVSSSTTVTAPAYGAAVAIPDNTPSGGFASVPTAAALASSGAASLSINVPAGAYTALTSISFNISHTWNEDLDIYLVAPNNTVYEISTDNGGNGDNYVGVVVQDGGGTFPTANTTPITGTFDAESATTFASYPAANLAGTWTLWVIDDDPTITGTLQNFRLNLGNAVFYAGTGGIPDNSPNGGIAAGNTVPTAAQLFASAGAVATVNVPAGTYIGLAGINFSVTQSQNSDLDIYLVAPNNTVYVISTDNGGNGDGYTNVTVNDTGGAFPTGNTNPITGTFQPEVGTFASYPAANCSGRWYLYVIDGANNDTGSITAFSVTVNQSVGTNFAFHNLTMNNTSTTGTVLLNTQITINGTSTFTNGRLYTSEAFRVNYIAGSATSLANANSYIEGWARKTGNTAFEFPLGGSGYAAPIRFTPTSGSAVTDHFTATYRRITPNTGSPSDNGNVNTSPFNNVAPYPILSKEASINHVSNVEYWILERTNGSAQGTVHLSYNDTRSGGAGLPADLLVCRWNGGTPIWENKGNGGTSAGGGFTYVQSTAGSFTAFSPVTLGSTTRFNVLPVTWLDFTVKKVGTTAELAWKTREDGKNQGFEIERSVDGQNFATIGTVKPSTQELGNYFFIDKSLQEVAAPIVYYRIKQIDTDGVVTYSKVQTVRNDMFSAVAATIYPNPFKDFFTTQINTEEDMQFEVQVVDMLGKIVKQFTWQCKKGNNTLNTTTDNLPQGTYLLHLQSETKELNCKIVKE